MLSMLMPELTVGRKNAASVRSTCSIAAKASSVSLAVMRSRRALVSLGSVPAGAGP